MKELALQRTLEFEEPKKTEEVELYGIMEAIKKSMTDRNISVDISTEPIHSGFWIRRQIGRRIKFAIEITVIDGE